ncbi:MAG: pyridoxamine 5'-phosphate oxidase [Bacteroidota bacterium]
MTPSLPEFWQMALSELRRANADRRHPFRNTVLATSRHNIPSQRTVVMRKFKSDHSILIYTDSRSQKCLELGAHQESAAALLFWHPKKKLQIRLAGYISQLEAEEEKRSHWSNVPVVSKKSYTTTKPPGTVIESPLSVGYDTSFDDGRNFSMLHFHPISIEVLQLNEEMHLRAGFALENGDWNGHWLVP